MSQNFLGMSTWLRLAVEGNDLTPFAEFLLERANDDENDHEAIMDLSYVAQLLGNRDWGVALQLDTLKHQQVFAPAETSISRPRVKVLSVCSPGDLKLNTPIDCLFTESDNSLTHVFIGEGIPFTGRLPDHDAMFVSMAAHENNLQALKALRLLTDSNESRVVINHPTHLMALVDLNLLRQQLNQLHGVSFFNAESTVLERLTDEWLAHYRVLLIDGKPFVYHVSIAEKLVDYHSAEMINNEAKLNLEQTLIAKFSSDVADRFASQWDSLHKLFQLDYVGIDCAVSHDGNLIITQIDPAFFIHGYGVSDINSPKSQAYESLKNAFHQMIYKKTFPESKLFYRG